jgi:hypothetical protein
MKLHDGIGLKDGSVKETTGAMGKSIEGGKEK